MTIKKELGEEIKKLETELEELNIKVMETFGMKSDEGTKRRLELGKEKHIKVEKLKSLYKEINEL